MDTTKMRFLFLVPSIATLWADEILLFHTNHTILTKYNLKDHINPFLLAVKVGILYPLILLACAMFCTPKQRPCTPWIQWILDSAFIGICVVLSEFSKNGYSLLIMYIFLVHVLFVSNVFLHYSHMGWFDCILASLFAGTMELMGNKMISTVLAGIICIILQGFKHANQCLRNKVIRMEENAARLRAASSGQAASGGHLGGLGIAGHLGRPSDVCGCIPWLNYMMRKYLPMDGNEVIRMNQVDIEMAEVRGGPLGRGRGGGRGGQGVGGGRGLIEAGVERGRGLIEAGVERGRGLIGAGFGAGRGRGPTETRPGDCDDVDDSEDVDVQSQLLSNRKRNPC